jgi:hypothetical protein
MTTHETGTARLYRMLNAMEELGPIDYRAAADVLGIHYGMAWSLQWALGWVGASSQSQPNRAWFAPLPPEPEPDPQEPSDG